MAEFYLFNTDPVPGITDASDGGASGVTTATGCLFAAGGEVVGVRFRATTTVGGSETYTIAMWDLVSQTLLGSKSVLGSSITAGAYNRVDFDTPIAVDNSHGYVVGVWQSAGRYVATVNFFNSHNEGSLSNVYAWGDHENISSIVSGVTDARNGQSRVNSALAFPNNFTAAGYFVSPIWESEPSSNVSGTLVANLGGLTGTAVGERYVLGALAASLGGLTATMSGTPTATGTMATQLGALSATIQGTLEAKGLLTTTFGFLANIVGDRTHFGTGSATLGGLIATMIGGGGLAYLITTADIEDALGRAPYNAAEEAAWQQAIVVVSNYINSKVRVGFATTTVTATYQADSYGQIYLREPVTNIASIKNYRTQQEDLYVDYDGVYKLFNLEPQQVVVVTYTYGYSEPPQDIKDLATTLAIAQINESSAPVGLRRYKVGDVEEQYTGDGASRHILDDMINGVLDNYRRKWYSIPLSLEYFPDYVPRGFEDDFGS